MTDEMKAKRELLFSGSKNGYDRVDQQTLDAMEAYCRDYKSFLDHSKTERECTAHTVALAEAAGFIPYERGMALQPGDRVVAGIGPEVPDREAWARLLPSSYDVTTVSWVEQKYWHGQPCHVEAGT